jgi:ribosomal protein S18 acetylase RimI-like enzyme
VKFVPLGPEWETAFKSFLRALEKAGDHRRFKPHPFTDEGVKERLNYKGKDYYCLLVDGDDVVGYGMLRGWDEGYDVPSLGIAVRPGLQGTGRGRSMMQHLHDEARRLGAKKVRLRVNKDNQPAIRLYEEFGYDLKPDEKKGFLVGFATL